jgi:CHAT domain-containing protein
VVIPWLLAVALALPPQQAPDARDPAAAVRIATRAVEGDSAGRVRARLNARVRRDGNDRAALLGLATLSRLEYDYPAAESAYRRLAAGPRDRVTAYAHLGLAEGYEARSFGLRARPELESARAAARALADRAAEAEAMISLAFVRGRLEGVQVAEALLDSVARIVPEGALELRARLHSRNAIVNALRGRAPEASAEAEAGITMARRARATGTEADAQRVLGQVLQYRGQWDSALVALQASEALYLRARNRSALAASLIWHAQVLGSQGRYGDMRAVMQRALSEGEATHNPAAVADAQRAFGVLAEIAGDWPAAAAHLRRSIATSAATGDSSGVMTTTKYLARVALVAGDTATARRLTAERLAWAERAQDSGAQYEAQRVLADLSQLAGDTAAAGRALSAARRTLERLPGASYRVWLLHDEARHATRRGDLDSAVRLLESFLRGHAGAIGNLLRFDGRVRLADVHAQRGDVAAAERELTAATDEIDAWRSEMDDASLRTLAFQIAATIDAAAADPDALAAGAARTLAAMAAAGRVEAAFLLAERWRARELTDRITRGVALAAGARERPRSEARLAGARPSDARETLAALPDDRTALVEFVAAPGAPVTAFVVQKGGVQARVLGPLDRIAPDVARLNVLLESGADAERLARSLGAALLDPLAPLLSARVTRVVFVPHGVLHRVPFDALRLADGRYVVERWVTAVAPSASALAALWGRSTSRRAVGAPRLLAFGNPTRASAEENGLPSADAEELLAAAAATGGLPRLRGAAREARRVARYAPGADVRLGRDASAGFLKGADLRGYDVLHFATHALVDERSLGRTALALAPGPGESGFVSAGELAALELDAKLVVLSACRSAGGVLSGSEGVQGLTSSLLQAGARAVVASGWRIPDRDVVPLVDRFYAGLARGLPVAAALQAAKLEALRGGEPARTWAAFTTIGDPFVTVPLEAPRPWWTRLFSRS